MEVQKLSIACKKSNFTIMRYLFTCFIFVCILFSCKQDGGQLPLLDIKLLLSDPYEILNDSPGFLIEDARAILLDSTDNRFPESISMMTAFRDDLYLLVNGQLRRYNLQSGKFKQCYLPDQKFISFDLDTMRQKVYALDAERFELEEIIVDSGEHEKMELDNRYTYVQVCCQGDGTLILMTDKFPDPVVFRCNFKQDLLPLFPLNKGGKRYDLPDSVQCPLQIVGQGVDKLFYKYLLNDTVYSLKGDSCVPFVFCDFDNKGVQLKKRKQDLVNNERVCIIGLWETTDYWWVQYCHSIDFNESDYRFVTLGVLDKSQKSITGGYQFFIPGQKIYLNSRDRLYMDKEGTRFLQIYNEKRHKGERRELPFDLQKASDPSALLLNYFYIQMAKNNKKR